MVVLYFLPMLVAIVIVAGFARRNRSGQRPSRPLILAGLVIAVALGGLALWLAGVVR
jgi:hypothetical protein